MPSLKKAKSKGKTTPKSKAQKLEVKIPMHGQLVDAKKIFENAKVADGFDNFVSRLGLNNDNTLSAGLYTFNLITRNRMQLEAAYRGSWIAGQLIDCRAEDMTRAGINVTTNEADEDIKDLRSYLAKLKVSQSLCSTIKWGQLYGGAIGVLQIKGQRLETPLDVETVGKDQFMGIAVYDRWQLNPDLTNLIKDGPDVGLPAYYQIITTEATAQGIPGATLANTGGYIVVHHSRVVRYQGIELPYWQAITEMMWGESILERLWDRLISFDNATMSMAQLIDRANLRTVKIDKLREIIAMGGKAREGLEEMFETMRLMQVNEGITLLDKEDDFAATAYTFTGVADVILQLAQQLSGAGKVPLIRMLGQSPSGLNANADGDIRLYYDNINAEQEAELRPSWDKILRVAWRSKFGRPAPQDLEFKFVPLWQMSEKDKAEITKTNTETVIGAYSEGLQSLPAAMKSLRDMSGDSGLFSTISDEEIAEAEESAKLIDPPGTGELDLPPKDVTPKAVEAKKPEPQTGDPVKALDEKPKSNYDKIVEYLRKG